MNIISSVARASLWSVLSEIVAKTISPLVFLVMVRILSPQDFGLVAVATVILGFANVVSDMGMSKVIIQESVNDNHLNMINNIAFWFNAVIGLIVFSLLVIFSVDIASLFGEPKSSIIIRVMSFQVILFALSSVQTANRKKKLDFKALFFIRIITVGLPAFISIPLALYGFGFWALVAGSMVGSLASTVTLWITSTWKPSFVFDFETLKRLLAKGIWNTFESVFTWIPVSLDTILITRFLSTADLGLYTTSRNLFSVAIGLFLSPLIPVLFSTFSLIQNDKEGLKKAVLMAQKIIFTVSAFMGVGVFIYRDLIEQVLFSYKWIGISNIFGIIFLIFGFEYFFSASVESLRAKGYFRLVALNIFIGTAISVPILYISVSKGLYFYVWVRALLLFFQFPAVALYSGKLIGIKPLEYLNNTKNIIGGAISMLVVNVLLEYLAIPAFTKYAILSAFVILVFSINLISEKRNILFVFGKLKGNSI